MSTTATAVARYQPVMSEAEQTTLLGFLAGYRGYTRDEGEHRRWQRVGRLPRHRHR